MRFLEPISCLIIRLKFKFDIHENKFKLELIEELFPKIWFLHSFVIQLLSMMYHLIF